MAGGPKVFGVKLKVSGWSIGAPRHDECLETLEADAALEESRLPGYEKFATAQARHGLVQLVALVQVERLLARVRELGLHVVEDQVPGFRVGHRSRKVNLLRLACEAAGKIRPASRATPSRMACTMPSQ